MVLKLFVCDSWNLGTKCCVKLGSCVLPSISFMNLFKHRRAWKGNWCHICSWLLSAFCGTPFTCLTNILHTEGSFVQGSTSCAFKCVWTCFFLQPSPAKLSHILSSSLCSGANLAVSPHMCGLLMCLGNDPICTDILYQVTYLHMARKLVVYCTMLGHKGLPSRELLMQLPRPVPVENWHLSKLQSLMIVLLLFMLSCLIIIYSYSGEYCCSIVFWYLLTI